MVVHCSPCGQCEADGHTSLAHQGWDSHMQQEKRFPHPQASEEPPWQGRAGWHMSAFGLGTLIMDFFPALQFCCFLPTKFQGVSRSFFTLEQLKRRLAGHLGGGSSIASLYGIPYSKMSPDQAQGIGIPVYPDS